jgi:hypothetical protein
VKKFKNAFVIFGAIILVAFAIYYQNKSKNATFEMVGKWVTDYKKDGSWGDYCKEITITECGNNLYAISYIPLPQFLEGVEFCEYKNGCFYSTKNKEIVACQTENFHLIFHGTEYWLGK